MKNQFKETLNIFKLALENENYSTYWEWMLIPNNFKAAALYVQFYDEITLAWSKTNKPFIEEETAISTLMQYLIKNVDIIKENRKRFTPNYLYKIAFNAFYPLGRIQRNIDEWLYRRKFYDVNIELLYQCELDSDNVGYTDPFYISKFFVEDTYFSDEQDQIWDIINSCDEDTKRVIESLLGGRALGKKLTAKYEKIVSELRLKLKKILSLITNIRSNLKLIVVNR